MLPAGEYKEAVKEEVFTRIVSFFGDDWRYTGAGGFDENMIQASDINSAMRMIIARDSPTTRPRWR